MFESLTPRQRMALGLFLLLLVDIIWVGSSELTEYLFKAKSYNKPYFTTYLKTMMFILYLFGFILQKSWRDKCDLCLGMDAKSESCSSYLSAPVYVPINDDDGYSSIGSNEDTSPTVHDASALTRKAVRFSDHTEVRCMTDLNAEEAILARLSYESYLQRQAEQLRLKNSLSVKSVCKLALLFSVLWFLANYSYQEALLDTEAAIVNVLSSTSGLFTLVLAAVWSSGPGDRFTLSKLIVVLISLGGTSMVSLSDASIEMKFPVGAVWALIGALCYALYLVSLKREVKDDSQLNVPMFFGFVGLFNTLILWPGLLILNYTNWELFRLPSQEELLIMLVNGLVGTVLSELIWLWGCFLTSSLIGTLALSLTTPLTMLFDVCIKNKSYNWMFYAGVGPVFLSFLAITALSHYDNWDPALLLIKKSAKCVSRTMQSARLREMDQDQTERLLNNKDLSL